MKAAPTIKHHELLAFERALSALDAAPNATEAYESVASLVAPSLFQGDAKRFDALCAHAASARDGALLPALFSFMDKLTSRGDIAASSDAPAFAWRSCALLCELHPEDGRHDPCALSGLSDLRSSLASLFKVPKELVSVSPILADLRVLKPGFDLFRLAMLPTQLEAIDAKELMASNPCSFIAPHLSEPAFLWRAAMVSIAFAPGAEPESLADALRPALAAAPAFPCAYEARGEERSAVLVLKGAGAPFSCIAMALEPERAELESDLQAIAQAYGPSAASFCALIEPRLCSAPGPDPLSAPIDRFAIAICSPNGILVDALEFPALPESLALAHALLERYGVASSMSPPNAPSRDEQGRLLWNTPFGKKLFDPQTWRSLVLERIAAQPAL